MNCRTAFRQARLRAGWRQDDLARLVNRQQPYIAKVEAGRSPDLATAHHLARLLNLPVEILFPEIGRGSDDGYTPGDISQGSTG